VYFYYFSRILRKNQRFVTFCAFFLLMCYSPSTKNKSKEELLQKMGQKDISEKVLADYKTCG